MHTPIKYNYGLIDSYAIKPISCLMRCIGYSYCRYLQRLLGNPVDAQMKGLKPLYFLNRFGQIWQAVQGRANLPVVGSEHIPRVIP